MHTNKNVKEVFFWKKMFPPDSHKTLRVLEMTDFGGFIIQIFSFSCFTEVYQALHFFVQKSISNTSMRV